MDTRLRNLLHDLATEMPVDVEGSAPRTLRRARGRRILTAGASAAIVVALVVVSVSALRFADAPTRTPAMTGTNPSATFEGLWPETDAEALAVTQAAADQAHQPLRTTADGTATLLAVDLLGWQMSDVQIESTAVDGDEASVVIGNRVFADDVPVITVELRQLGATGPNGVWSVVGVSTPLIRLDEVRFSLLADPAAQELGPGMLRISGRVTDLYDGAPVLETMVLAGPTLDADVGGARLVLDAGTRLVEPDGTGVRFRYNVYVRPTPGGFAALLVTMPDAVGASLGALLISVETPVGELGPTVNVEGVPPDVAVTAQRIYDGALAHDFDALAQLLDPDTFVYNADDGSDPIPAWRRDPSVLERMVEVLELRAAAPRVIEGYGTFTIWPYLIDSDFDALTERERADLAMLGFSDADIELMIRGGHGYQGPRLAIDETGLWRNFITMGE
jgi:hypothetical protein